MSRMLTKEERPSIVVHVSALLKETEEVKDILNGIEEEGLPVKLVAKEEADAVKLSYDACLNSVFGVGIGIAPEGYALHYHKLEENKPLYYVMRNSTSDNRRNLGANAARIVKRMPFKEVV